VKFHGPPHALVVGHGRTRWPISWLVCIPAPQDLIGQGLLDTFLRPLGSPVLAVRQGAAVVC
jgi:hypothetical protein